MSVIKCLQLKVTYDQNKCYTSAICKSGHSLAVAVALDCFCEFDHGPFKQFVHTTQNCSIWTLPD